MVRTLESNVLGQERSHDGCPLGKSWHGAGHIEIEYVLFHWPIMWYLTLCQFFSNTV